MLLVCVVGFFIGNAFCDDVGHFLRRDNSLVAPFSGGWTSYGTTVSTPRLLKLTSDIKSARGGIYNMYPLYSRDWEVHLSFRVHGSSGLMFGDGFAFWYTQSPIRSGPALGAQEIFRGLGIFFDTYSNHNGEHTHEHPFISSMVSNGSVAYDHDMDGTHTQLAGCHSPFRNKPFDTLVAIRYSKNTLQVSTDIHNEGKWIECFKVDNVYLPTGYYLGLSAATGDLSDNHDISYLKTYELEYEYTDAELLEDRSLIEPYADSAEPQRDHVPDPPPPSRWSTFFRGILWLVGFCLVFAGVYFGYLMYRNRRSRSKRLY